MVHPYTFSSNNAKLYLISHAKLLLHALNMHALLTGFANASQEIDNELDSEIQVLQQVKQKLAGK